MSISGDKKTTTLNPHEIAILLGFPSELQERISRGQDYTSPSNVSVEDDQSNAKDMSLMDLDRERTSIMDSVNSIERRIERTEDSRREHIKELEAISDLTPSLHSQKESYVKKLIEIDREIHENLGVDSGKQEMDKVEVERPYPIRGVTTIGFLIAFLGFLILFPFELPTTLKFMFGAGLLLIGLSVLMGGFLHTRKK